jgi:hypothetical protein
MKEKHGSADRGDSVRHEKHNGAGRKHWAVNE